MGGNGHVYGLLVMLAVVCVCLEESVAHADEHASDHTDKENKRAFGSLTKPSDDRNVQRLFLRQRPGQTDEIESVDMKRQSYSEQRQSDSEPADYYYLGAQFPPEGLEDYYGDDGDQEADFLPVLTEEQERDENADANDDDEDEDEDENIEKRPFGVNGGRVGKRETAMDDMEKRPFGRLFAGKRPFGSLTGRYKRPAFPMWGRVGKRPAPMWGKVGKRPAPMWGKVGKRPSMPMWGKVGKRPAPMWGKVGKRPAPMWGKVGKRPSMPMWGTVGKRPAPMWGKVGKRPSMPMWGTVGKRPAPMWGKVGKRPAPMWGKVGKRPAPMWGKVGKRPSMPMWGKVGKKSDDTSPFRRRRTADKRDTLKAKRPFLPIHGIVG